MSRVRRTNGRRWARGAAAAVAVVGLSGVLAACGGGGEPEESITIQATEKGESASALVADASQSTGEVETGRMRFGYEISGSGQGETFDMTMTGTGSFADFGTKAEMTVDMGGSLGELAGEELPGTFVMRQIIDGTDAYMKVETDQAIPGFAAGWMKVDLGEAAAGGPAGGLGSGLGSGPSGILESLKGAGADVAEIGADTIDGVEVTVYEGTLDPTAALDSASPDKVDELQSAIDQYGMTSSMPFTVYIDDDGLVRRLQLDMDMDADLMSMRMVMTMDFYDFGAPITIVPPSPDEVTDLEDTFGGLGGLGRERGTA